MNEGISSVDTNGQCCGDAVAVGGLLGEVKGDHDVGIIERHNFEERLHQKLSTLHS